MDPSRVAGTIAAGPGALAQYPAMRIGLLAGRDIVGAAEDDLEEMSACRER